MKRDQYKPHAVSVLRRHSATESLEDESPTMATPAPTLIPPVIILRPSWLDLPARTLVSRITLLGVCTIPAAIILTAAIHAAWRLS